jgi:hypothetical protein
LKCLVLGSHHIQKTLEACLVSRAVPCRCIGQDFAGGLL